MRDQREDGENDVPDAGEAGEGEATSRALSITGDNRETGLALPSAEAVYTQLFARLQTVLDNATQTIRDLRRENAELSDRLSLYDSRARMQAENVGKAAELHRAAARLEELLEPESTLAADVDARPAPPSLYPAREPVPSTPDAQYAAPTNGVLFAPDVPRVPQPPGAMAGTPAGTYTLIVYPFTRFSELGQFQSALHSSGDIDDVQVRRFAQGTLEMRLTYNGALPLAQVLHDLPVRVREVDEEEPYRLRVRLHLLNDA